MNTTKIVLIPEEHTKPGRRVRSAAISQRDDRRTRVILLASQGGTRENSRDWQDLRLQLSPAGDNVFRFNGWTV